MRHKSHTFTIAFPVVFFVVTFVMLRVGYNSQPPVPMDSPPTPTILTIAFGLNAPARVVSAAIDEWVLEPWYFRVDQRVPSILGFSIDVLIFLLMVILLWSFVGNAIDHWLQSRTGQCTSLNAPRRSGVLFAIASTILGGILIYFGAVALSPQHGTRLTAFLLFSWGLVLLVPAFSVIRKQRQLRL